MNKSKYPKPMLTTFGIWIPRKFSLNENQNPGRSTFISIFFDWKIANKTRFQMRKSIRFTFNTYYNAVPKHLFSMHSIMSKSTTKFNIRQLRFFFTSKFLSRKSKKDFRFSHSCWGLPVQIDLSFALRLFPLTELKLSCAISSHVYLYIVPTYKTESPNTQFYHCEICAHDVFRAQIAQSTDTYR